jgi:hypothetical protein
MKQINTWSWSVALAAGVLSLMFYRSPHTGHGPDMVGDEVSHFIFPMVLALFLSIMPLFRDDPLPFKKFVPPLAVVIVAISSLLIYGQAIMR